MAIRTMLAVAALIGVLAMPVVAQEEATAPAAPNPTEPVTNDADGKARTALPEQDVSPRGTGERPNSPASRKAEEIK